MKKELLIASALVSTMGVASVAEAVTYTMSGNHRAGVVGSSVDSAAGDTTAVSNQSSFTVSLEETTDNGMTISSSFMLANEAVDTGLGTAGITLAFTDGSSLDLLNAGNAAATHDVSIPGSAGEEGLTITTTNNAPTGLDFFGAATALGLEWHSAPDFVSDGLSISVSWSTDDGAANSATAIAKSHAAIGATYVYDAGETDITVGAGYSETDYGKTGAAMTDDENGFHIGFSAVTGEENVLTIAAGFGDGSSVEDDGTVGNGNASTQNDGDVVRAGVSYVIEDITIAVGVTAGEANDSDTIGTAGATADNHDVTDASVSYAVASGVTAILGYTNQQSKDEGQADTSDGSSWYIGANLSF